MVQVVVVLRGGTQSPLRRQLRAQQESTRAAQASRFLRIKIPMWEATC